MIKKHLISFVIIVSLFYSITLYSQNEQLNLVKYWYYRDRLKHFVIPGLNKGESEAAGIRNRFAWDIANNKNIDFGQNGCYFGYYLGILATEYQILVNNERSPEAECDLSEIQFALDQFIEYMDKCEHYFGDCNSDPKFCDTYNGFFVRTGVTEDFLDPANSVGRTLSGDISHLKILNQDLTESDTWNAKNQFQFGELPKGHPGWIENVESKETILSRISYDEVGHSYYGYESMSQDEAIGILLGLALIYRYVPSLSSEVAEIADQIILKVSNGDSWIIPAPNTSGGTQGFNALSYSFGFASAGQYFGFIPFRYIPPGSIFCTNFQLKRDVWLGIATQTKVKISNCVMECTLAAIGDSWGWYFGPCTTVPQISNTMSAITQKCIDSFYQTADPAGIKTFYCLLFNRLHPNHSVSDEILDDTYSELCVAPGEGPYFYNKTYGNFSGGGWAYSYAWHGTYEENYGLIADGTAGNFSGMDYMLLYNLYVLASGRADITGYYPRSNAKLANNWPIKFNSEVQGDINAPERFVACNRIESDAKIRNTVRYNHLQQLIPENQQISSPANISYMAKSINLKPGFCVERNAKFIVTAKSHVFWDEFKMNTKYYSHFGLVEPTIFGCWYNYPFVTESENSVSYNLLTGLKESFPSESTLNPGEIVASKEIFKVYPNPAETTITIEFQANTFQPYVLKLINSFGQTIIKLQIVNPLAVVDITDIPKGVYIVQTSIFGKETVNKLIKI